MLTISSTFTWRLDFLGRKCLWKLSVAIIRMLVNHDYLSINVTNHVCLILYETRQTTRRFAGGQVGDDQPISEYVSS